MRLAYNFIVARRAIPTALRSLVIARAKGLCEYCVLPVAWAALPHHVDHIRALKHSGTTTANNLAYACFACNVDKGSDIASFDPLTDQLVRLYNPRSDLWSTHFILDSAHIVGLDPIGRATVQLLHFNDDERLLQRELLITASVYPPV